MATDSNRTDTFPYPRGTVVAVVNDGAMLDEARRGLEEAGFEPSGCEVLHGDEGLARMDVDGTAHGRGGRIVRKLQGIFSDDGEHARRYEEHLRAGHYIVGVKVGDDEPAKQRAAHAFHAAHAEFVNYYAENYVEDLGAKG